MPISTTQMHCLAHCQLLLTRFQGPLQIQGARWRTGGWQQWQPDNFRRPGVSGHQHTKDMYRAECAEEQEVGIQGRLHQKSEMVLLTCLNVCVCVYVCINSVHDLLPFTSFSWILCSSVLRLLVELDSTVCRTSHMSSAAAWSPLTTAGAASPSAMFVALQWYSM